MNISKIQSYNLSPDQYLQKFQKAHSVISYKGKQQNYQSQIKLLEKILDKYNDTQKTLQLKQKAIKQLTQIVQRWMNAVIQDYRQEKVKEINHNNTLKNYHDLSLKDLEKLGYGFKIFGSYSLKTNSYDSDIDMICVVPQYFSRQRHFYTILTEQLKKNQHIKKVGAIPDAMVPLIKLIIYDIEIDMLISRIPINFMKQNPNFLKGQLSTSSQTHNIFNQEKQLKSINGYRTILYLKENIKHYQNFQVVLKAIKMWAKNKRIYSQNYGYLGGAALSIMLAKICQLYPNYSPLQLIDRFFFIYANWIWTLPIVIEDYTPDVDPNGGLFIYTPLYPHINAAYYVSKVTCHITRKYLKLASKLIQQINKKKKEWKDLFQPLDFFKTYQNYIQLSVMGQKYQQFIVWKGVIQSRLRKFIQSLQNQIQSIQLIEIHPCPTYFLSKHPNYKYCYKYYFGLRCQSNPSLDDYLVIDITQSVKNFLDILQSCSTIDKIPKQLNIGFAYIQKKDLQKQIIEGVKDYTK